MSASRHPSSDILAFWRKVEFFVPYEVQDASKKETENQPAFYTLQQLHGLGENDLWAGKMRPDYTLQGFYLYLNLFPQQALVDEVLALTGGGDDMQENLPDYKNISCFGRLQVDTQGVYLADTLELASAPWAVGRCRQFGWDALDFAVFEEEAHKLRTQLQYHLQQSVDTRFWLKQLCSLGMRYGLAGLDAHGVQTVVDAMPDRLSANGQAPRILNGNDLLLIVELLHQWSYGFHPACMRASDDIIAIRPIWRKIPASAKEHADAEKEDDGDETSVDSAGGIFNSFYAADLAKIGRAVEAGVQSPVLHAYLTARPQAQVDLYSAAGYAAIGDRLQPQFYNRGRWPEKAEYALSLMQQFAVNAFFHDARTMPLFSVNGPPGTGKTTLLRDIFAENIVRRAGVLAQLPCVQAAFAGKMKIRLSNGEAHVSQLIPELTGFEMVVVSSNNNAVENITRDLPKRSALGGEYREHTAYLQSVAHNYFAYGKEGYATLADADIPWGLFSCMLGNMENRRKFKALVFSTKQDKKGFDRNLHRGLWDWLKAPYPLSFADAQRRFTDARRAVDARIAALQEYAAFRLRHPAEKAALDSALAQAEADTQAAGKQSQAAQDALDRAKRQRDAARLREEACAQAEARHAANRPPWWARLLYLAGARRWKKEEAHLRQAFSLAREARCECEAACLEAENDYADAANRLTECRQACEAARTACARLQSRYEDCAASFPEARCPADSTALAEDAWQIDGLWHDSILNTLRSELFVSALTLHEAWLHAAAQNNVGFGGNLYAISLAITHDISRLPAEEALPIWQSVFMIVPVVSSTFAAFARQFGNLGAQSLGCVIIDEAGQAPPQASAGALWRAKRALVVGDPLQIEPVFTVPAALVNRLEAHAALDPACDVSPVRVSVQNLADRANPFGANMAQANNILWTGSPLRVHRRCADPMFAISNQIAYQNRMIHPAAPDSPQRRPSPHGCHPGPSAWVECAGQCSERQYVAAQGELVCRAVRALYAQNGKLPPLYIITPFRTIRDRLQAAMLDAAFWQTLPAARHPLPKVWSRWVENRIGTVHTFQGREEEMVWLVLGCDAAGSGAAAWAAEKPNLLNVALTRAKQRIFIIGESALWRGQPYFDHAAATLPHISASAFLQRAAGKRHNAEPDKE